MKNLFLITIIYCCFNELLAQKKMSTEQIMASDEVLSPDRSPFFPGCEDSILYFNFCAYELLHNFIYDNLQYPNEALAKGIQGKVHMRIIVEKTGKISSWSPINSATIPEFVEEAVRIIRLMPNWIPGEIQGIKVRSYTSLQFDFQIKDGAMVRPKQIDVRKLLAQIEKGDNKPKTTMDPQKAAAQHETQTIHVQDKEKPEFYDKLEKPPLFPGCENETDLQAKKSCSTAKMLAYVDANLKYPEIAIDNNVQGTVYVKFVVEKDGSLTNIEIIRDIGAGCGEEVVRLVKMMPKWEPGTRRGRPDRVQFNMPVKFKL
ncbi:MAG: TonB family protein [Saprospiraceae bacterium]|nr:TonB family protein [Saprospiraceae bacterium]